MPRQDVPYGGAICRLKERIAEIWDELGKKLHSINGVEGDAAGDVKIVSGDAAVVITSDQVNHQIEVALDSSQLPAASVSSVNGQTGAVALDAGDIPTVGGDVQSDIQDLANDISANTAAINTEVLARQGADSALQTNINAVSASLPSAAAAAVAADNTIVRTTGNQNIADVKTVATEATGTYSQQIANSQKVRNEINTYAVTTTGNQNIGGIKTSTTFWNVAAAYPLNPPDSVAHANNVLRIVSSDNIEVARFIAFFFADGSTGMQLAVRNADGTLKTTFLLRGNP